MHVLEEIRRPYFSKYLLEHDYRGNLKVNNLIVSLLIQVKVSKSYGTSN